MDDEFVAKRRRLNHVEEAFGTNSDQLSRPYHPRDCPTQVRDILIPLKKSNNFDIGHSCGAQVTSDREAAVGSPSRRQGCRLQPLDDSSRLKNVSWLDQPSCVKDETPLDVVRSIAGAVEEIGTSGTYNANEGRCATWGGSEVCFGMIMVPNIAVLEPRILSPNAGRVDVQLVNGQLTTLSRHQYSNHPIGSIQDQHDLESVLQMQRQDSLRLQMYCQVQPSFTSRAQACKQCELSIIIYGLGTTSDSVGDYLQACGLYLQDPEYCDRDAPYKNPHCLASLGEDDLMTSSLQIPANIVENVHDPSRIFDNLSGVREMEETETPFILKTPLKSHQKQGLTFLLRRERGWALELPNEDVWTKVGGPDSRYCNNVTGEYQNCSPPQFHGGILADHMGLGKTLQIIALVAADVAKSMPSRHIPLEEIKVANTLIVVPFPLLETWTDQLEQFVSIYQLEDSVPDYDSHILPKAMTWYVYHGRQRKLDISELARFNIVLTTYETVVADKKKALSQAAHQKSLFGISWQRIILDEAHLIGRISTLRTQAVCSLNARCRWAVTGTPIQNRLTDLGTLLHFLRVHPFDDLGVFDKEFLRPWKTQLDPSALNRLKALVKFITLRRSKEILHLMPREDHVRYLQFSSSERTLYETIRNRTRDEFPELLSATTSGKVDYFFHILAWIDDLRQFCNHGLINECSKSPLAQRANSLFHSVGSVEPLDSYPGAVPMEDPPSLDVLDRAAQISSKRASKDSGISSDASNNPSISTAMASQNVLNFSIDQPESGLLSPRSSEWATPDPSTITSAIPTKIERLIQDLTDKDDDQKSIVFSFWKTTLDLIPAALEAVGLRYTRLDGRLTKSQRSQSLNKFRTNPNIKVLLATLSVAGFGLDLTVASRAFILEPQWNPMAEEQALSRIHRMGQTKAVKTVRYIMKDSIEENIYELQQRKLKLAALTISGEVKPDDQSRLEDLRFLLS